MRATNLNPDAKLATRVHRIVASSELRVKASLTVEKAVSCYIADRLVASLPSFRSIQSSLAVCKFGAAGKELTLRTRPRVGVCEPLMPDVVASKAHQNNRNYVSSADLPSDSLRKDLAGWVVTRRTSKRLLWYGRLLGTMRYSEVDPSSSEVE